MHSFVVVASLVLELVGGVKMTPLGIMFQKTPLDFSAPKKLSLGATAPCPPGHHATGGLPPLRSKTYISKNEVHHSSTLCQISTDVFRLPP